jgi:siderophore synthetase component
MQIDDYQALIQSDHYRRATQRVIRQLMEALLFEDVFRDAHWTTGSVTLPAVAADGQPVRYRCALRRIDAFGRIRLGNVIRAHGGDETAADDVSRLLHELAGQFDADPQRIQQFAMELLSTQLKDAHSHHANGASGHLLRDADYDTVEARLTGAHPYHPSYKSRLGFTMIDNARFAPECASAVHPVLLAARRDRCRTSASATVPGQNAGALLSDTARQHFDAALARYGADPADYLPLPVHPWQWAEVAAPTFHAAFAQGDLIAIGTLPERYLPQQSIRTLASLDHPGAPSLKLAMNMVNTSTSRVLAPHTVCNAAPLSDWLASLVGGTTWTPPMAAPILLREVAGVSYMPAAPAQGQYGALSCIWRESIHGHLAPGERALPMTALAHRDSDGEPARALARSVRCRHMGASTDRTRMAAGAAPAVGSWNRPGIPRAEHAADPRGWPARARRAQGLPRRRAFLAPMAVDGAARADGPAARARAGQSKLVYRDRRCRRTARLHLRRPVLRQSGRVRRDAGRPWLSGRT